jgi:23S rRNA (guanosine2251-2'-O)-methyltransferase
LSSSRRNPTHKPRPPGRGPGPSAARARPSNDRPAGGPEGEHLVPGPRAVAELLAHAPARIVGLWLDVRREGSELHVQAQAAGVPVTLADARALAHRAPDLDSQGVLALARPPAWRELDDLLDAAEADRHGPDPARRVIVALDGVQDPQNLGAIIRTCEFFGVLGLFWPRDRAATVTPAVVRASAGASERLALCRVVNLARALETCRDRGVWVLGTVADGGEPLPRLVAEDRVPDPLVLVMGAEHGGLRRLTRARCDLLATIPGRGGVASLNVSAATAAALVLLA